MTFTTPTEAALRQLSDADVMALDDERVSLYGRWFAADTKAQEIAATLADAQKKVADTEQMIFNTEQIIKRWWPKISAHENWQRMVQPERFQN